MKYLALCLLSMTFLLCGPALAQKGGQPKKVRTLVDYKTELSLTDQQIEDIRESLKAFQTTVVEQRKLLRQYEGEYAKLVADHAPLDQVKQKLRQVTDTGFNLRYADVLTSRKVESILTADQLQKWRQIQTRVRGAKSLPD
jgi:hypothetical protein